jgi:hypothetical protein
MSATIGKAVINLTECCSGEGGVCIQGFELKKAAPGQIAIHFSAKFLQPG